MFVNKLPLFPLELVLLPFEELPLHIFELRYRKMISKSLQNNTPFGIVYKDKTSFFKIGCEAKVSKVIKAYSDGRFDLIIKGVNRFQVIDTYVQDDLIFGEIKIIKENFTTSNDQLNELIENYIKILIKTGNTNFIEQDLNKKYSFEFIKNILLPLDIKKKLISFDDEQQRIDLVNRLFKKLLTHHGFDKNNFIPEA
tara:strand:+ start:115 stop:705 length:591 start_codon:yes stop_codon:yes gene_type:complete